MERLKGKRERSGSVGARAVLVKQGFIPRFESITSLTAFYSVNRWRGARQGRMRRTTGVLLAEDLPEARITRPPASEHS